jgi:hypothetical protein
LDPAMALYRGEGTTISGLSSLFGGSNTTELLFVAASDDDDLTHCSGPFHDPLLVITITAANAGIYSLAVANFGSGTCPTDGNFDFQVVIDPAPSCDDGDVKLEECEFDCDIDDDCASGLQCADAHKAHIKAAGYDERKANCGNVGTGAWNEEVCYEPANLIVRKECSSTNKCGLCDVDCDTDEDCEGGLQYADAHNQDLSDAGYDDQKADCGNVGAWNDEVCFDPDIICP